MRILAERPLEMIPALASGLPGHFDLARAKQGGLGACVYVPSVPSPILIRRAFFTVWAPCPDQVGVDIGKDFQNPSEVSPWHHRNAVGSETRL